MGLYRRTKRRRDGTIRKSRVWWMSYMIGKSQRCESTKTTNRRLAERIWTKRITEITEGRFRLPRTHGPGFEEFSKQFLDSIRHPNTSKRYATSIVSLKAHFGDIALPDLNPEGIDEFKEARLANKVRAATVNRDLAVLRRMLNIAERKRLIGFNPFREVEMLEESKERRQPHILTYKEEAQLLSVASDLIRTLSILILETGLRCGKEALPLRWADINFSLEEIQVSHSKTVAGVRPVPMSKRCKSELMKWRDQYGPEFSQHVFANSERPEVPLKNVRREWPRASEAAGLSYFWLYDLRHTFGNLWCGEAWFSTAASWPRGGRAP